MSKVLPIMQVAFVTRDLEATEDALTQQFGAKKWFRSLGFETDPANAKYLGVPTKFVADVSLSYADAVQLEIIVPVSGDANPYEDYLETHGPGIHHTCIEVDDIEKALADYATNGVETVFRLSVPQLGSFAYVRHPATGSAYLELAQFAPEAKAHSEWMKAECR